MKIYHLGATHLDNFPDDLREVVNDQWEKFPPQHPLIVDLFGVIFFLLWALSFLGNGCVMWIFLTTKSIRTPVNLKLNKTGLGPFSRNTQHGSMIRILISVPGN